MKFASCIVKGALRKLKNVGDRANRREGSVTGGYEAGIKTEGSRRARILLAIYRGGFG